MNPATFNIVLLHEDAVSGVRGSSVVDRLSGQLEMSAGQLETDSWKFDALRKPSLRALALARLMQANMIIVSASGANDLPAPIQELIEDALALRSEHDAAIVALLDWERVQSGRLPRLGLYLRNLALKTGLDFFCNKGEWQPQPEPALSFVGSAREPAFAGFPGSCRWDS